LQANRSLRIGLELHEDLLPKTKESLFQRSYGKCRPMPDYNLYHKGEQIENLGSDAFYRIGDMLHGYFRSNPRGGEIYHIRNFPNSLVARYFRATRKNWDMEVFVDCVREKFGEDQMRIMYPTSVKTKDACQCIDKKCAQGGHFSAFIKDHKRDGSIEWCFTQGDCVGGQKSIANCPGNFWATTSQGAWKGSTQVLPKSTLLIFLRLGDVFELRSKYTAKQHWERWYHTQSDPEVIKLLQGRYKRKEYNPCIWAFSIPPKKAWQNLIDNYWTDGIERIVIMGNAVAGKTTYDFKPDQGLIYVDLLSDLLKNSKPNIILEKRIVLERKTSLQEQSEDADRDVLFALQFDNIWSTISNYGDVLKAIPSSRGATVKTCVPDITNDPANNEALLSIRDETID